MFNRSFCRELYGWSAGWECIWRKDLIQRYQCDGYQSDKNDDCQDEILLFHDFLLIVLSWRGEISPPVINFYLELFIP
jgi:hypothetical protein